MMALPRKIKYPALSPFAFTLVELMVACAILSVIALLLLSVFTQMARHYQSTESRASTYRGGRAALQRLGSELESLVNINAERAKSFQNPAVPEAASVQKVEVTFGRDPLLAFFVRVSQKAQPSAQNKSDLCLVGYFVAADPGDGRKSLYRCLIPSDETYNRLKGGTQPFFRSDDKSPGALFSEPIAENVIDFKIKVLDDEFTEVDATSTNQSYIDIALTAIGGNSADAYFSNGTSDALRKSIERTEGRMFKLRVRLPGSQIASP